MQYEKPAAFFMVGNDIEQLFRVFPGGIFETTIFLSHGAPFVGALVLNNVARRSMTAAEARCGVLLDSLLKHVRVDPVFERMSRY